jgi:hypothetical protein
MAVATGAGRLAAAVCLDEPRVQAELQPAPLRHLRSLGGRRPAGDLDGGDRRRTVGCSQQVTRCACFFAGDAWQALDQRAELVLAEQAQDFVAVVVAQAGGLELEFDRHVGAHGDQRSPAEDVVLVLGELGTQLLRLDLIDVLIQVVQMAKLLKDCRRRLLADT